MPSFYIPSKSLQIWVVNLNHLGLEAYQENVRAAEMRYAISRAGQYDIQSKLTWMVDSLISSKPAFSEDREELSQSDEAKLVSALIRSIRGERVKNQC